MSRRRMMLATVRSAAPVSVFWRPVNHSTSSNTSWAKYPGSSQSNMQNNINQETPDDTAWICLTSVTIHGSCYIGFNGPTLPGTITSVTVRVRIANRRSSGAVSTDGYTFKLWIDGTEYFSQALTATWTTYEITIAGANTSGWNFSNLQCLISGSNATTARRPSLAWMEMEFQ